jgi:TetR/AcrR family transcriptional regulator, transcriptional repressor for nem operon
MRHNSIIFIYDQSNLFMLNDIQPLIRSHGERKLKQQNTRDKLLDVGLRKVMQAGWAATGIEVVLKECAVPKGSFYHYFSSKEAFGEALIQTYQAAFMQRLQGCFAQQSQQGLASVQAGLDRWLTDAVASLGANGYQSTCLVAAMGQELAGQHEAFRAQLAACVAQWESTLAQALWGSAQAYYNQNLKPHKNFKATGLKNMAHEERLMAACLRFAQTFWVQWQGALLLCLLRREPSALHAAVQNLMGQWTHWLTDSDAGSSGLKTALKKSTGGLATDVQASAVASAGAATAKVAAPSVTKLKKPLKIKDLQAGLDF